MAGLAIKLLLQRKQTARNLARWAELLADRELARIEGRIETDRHGRIILTPPQAPWHGGLMARVSTLLHEDKKSGGVFCACPISTADGVKAADAAWASVESLRELGNQPCFPRAPEICVEVLSPKNSEAEMKERTALYFDAGAREVWLCSESGKMTFFANTEEPLTSSKIFPKFPKQIVL